jgi:hypothetical protein
MNTRTAGRYAVEYPRARVDDTTNVLTWCEENFGESGFKQRWVYLDYTIQFRDKKDRDWFILRWGTDD